MMDALIARKGPKGELLDAALKCERGRFPARDLADLHMEAMVWATQAVDELFEGSAPAEPAAA
jgi:hypothetical protein